MGSYRLMQKVSLTHANVIDSCSQLLQMSPDLVGLRTAVKKLMTAEMGLQHHLQRTADKPASLDVSTIHTRILEAQLDLQTALSTVQKHIAILQASTPMPKPAKSYAGRTKSCPADAQLLG